MKDVTYVEAAGWGKYRGWRYGLGLMIIWSGSFFAAPALFSISDYHARFYDIISIVLIPVFLVIVFRVFKHNEASEPVDS